MAMNKGALLLVTLFLASASISLAYSKDQLVQELDQCLHRCNILRWSPERVRQCEADCAHDYYTKTQQDSTSQNTMEPIMQYKLDLCKEKCELKDKPFECVQKCETKFGKWQPTW